MYYLIQNVKVANGVGILNDCLLPLNYLKCEFASFEQLEH
jgi:hypothetical protein